MTETPSFDFDLAAPDVDPCPIESGTLRSGVMTAPCVTGPERRAGLQEAGDRSSDSIRDQIIRDSRVLSEDPIYHVPSREFYEQRIAAYKEMIND